MKRIAIQETAISKINKPSLKKLYDNSDIDWKYITNFSEPLYDPQDIHVHIWMQGPLKYVQNHRDPLISEKIPNSKIVKYCMICHEIFDNNLTSTTKLTSNEKINNLMLEKKIHQNYFNSKESKLLNRGTINVNINKNMNKGKENSKEIGKEAGDKKILDSKNMSVFIQKAKIDKFIKVEILGD